MSNTANTWRNWSGEVVCQPAAFASPGNETELRRVLQQAHNNGQCVRTTGSGHSFTPLCATDGVLVSLQNMTGITQVDASTQRVRVRAGTSLNALNHALAEHGLAMENLGDIDVQSIAGALATGTHGTGVTLGSLSTQVTGMRLLLADGQSLWCDASDNADIFRIGRVHLGALGIVTEIELACRPSYRLHCVSRKQPLEALLSNLEACKTQHRNFECFWFPYSNSIQVKTMNLTDAPETGSNSLRKFNEVAIENGLFWALCQVARLGYPTARAMSRLAGSAVPVSERIAEAHHAYASPRSVRFHETEYAIPAEHFPAAFAQIRAMLESERIAVNFPLEIRFVAADDIPLSPAHGRASAYIAAHMFKAMPQQYYFKQFTQIMDQYGGRPHWGKGHHKTAQDFARLYPKWNEFLLLRKRLDPDGLFLNHHLRQVFGL